MPYTKTTWTETTLVTTTDMNNAETQYTLAYDEAVVHNHDDRYYTTIYTDANYWHKGNDGPDSGCDADMIYNEYGENLHFSDFVTAGIVPEIIMMWDGIEAPTGWVECNSAPDLQDKFILAAGLSYGPQGALGSNTCDSTYLLTVLPHQLTEPELPAHTHTWYDSKPGGGGYASGGDQPLIVGATAPTAEYSSYTGSGTAHSHGNSWVTQTATPNNNLPRCVALRYIIKT